MCPPPRAAIASASRSARTIGARRLTASARSSVLDREAVERPLAGHAGVGDQHVDVAGLARSGGRPRRGSARSHGHRPRAELGRERLEHVRTTARQDEARAARGERPRDRVAEPAGGAGEEDRRARRGSPANPPARRSSRARADRARHGPKTATVAVKPCRKYSPPTGPISPAAKKPAAGAPASSRVDRGGVVVRAAEHRLAAAVAGEHQRAGGRRARRAPRMRMPSASRRSRSALAASRACSRTTWPGRTSAPTDDRPLSGSAPDEPADEEVAVHVLRLVGVDDDAHQQAAVDERALGVGEAPRSPRAAARAPAGRRARG